MSQEKKPGWTSSLKFDIPASIVVFLVAMPLCLGIALVSDAPPIAGIIAGIIGGIVVGAISGSTLGVSGPAAGLAVIVATAIGDFGEAHGAEKAFPIFLLAVVLAGVIQIVLGLVRAGVIGYYFPNTVIKGMLTGIGLVIIIKQIPHVFGYDKLPWGDWSFLQSDGENSFSEVLLAMKDIHFGSIVIFVVCLGILIFWSRPFMARIQAFRWLQGPLVAVIAGVILNLFFGGHHHFGLADSQIVSIPAADSLKGFAALFTFPDFSYILDPDVWITAVILAVVASLETLLCVEATDKLDPEKSVTPTNRELLAQGSGNVLAGLIGGLPITQVIVRSSANIQSGGKTKKSAIIHGFLLLIAVVSIPTILNLIPQASLAAILVIVGYKLAKPALFKAMFNAGLPQFIPFIVTVLGIVFIDLLWGIGLGLIVAIMHILWANYRLPLHFEHGDETKGEPVTLKLAEEVSFLNKAGIQRALALIPDGRKVLIDARGTRMMHPDIVEIIDDFIIHAELHNLEVEYLEPLEKKIPHPMRELNKILVGK